MFVNEDYLNYKYLVSVSDNYVVLTNRSSISADWQNPKEYNVIYQYFNPSYLTLEATRTTSQSLSFNQIDVSNSFWDRADCHFILLSVFILVLLIMFVVNQVTEFITKGGLMR